MEDSLGEVGEVLQRPVTAVVRQQCKVDGVSSVALEEPRLLLGCDKRVRQNPVDDEHQVPLGWGDDERVPVEEP